MLSFSEIDALVQTMIKPSRYTHTLGVVESARELALLHGADAEKCALAALVHDCAKSLTNEELLETIRRGNIKLYPGEEDYPELLHAPAGAVIARERFGIMDDDILSAVRHHTIGKKDMNLIELIIYLADYIEPNRAMHEGLDRVRELCRDDLNAAFIAAKELTDSYCRSQCRQPFIFT